jgi:hypothetical protein
MELRRALFLWPDGFEWRGEGDLRTAQSDCGTKLDARLAEGGRPTSVSASLTDPDAWIATYRDITWRELRGRWWPASMRLELVGHAVWTETVDSIETAIHLLDEFFVPPDRRVTGVAPNVVRADLPAALELRVALPVDCDWAAARERASQLEAGELAKLVAAGWRADVGQWFALDERGRPSACVLRLRPTAGAAPSGWALSRESTAVCAAVSSLETELAAVLGRVRSTIPPGALAATPMVRVVTAGAQTRVQLVLPLRPAR